MVSLVPDEQEGEESLWKEELISDNQHQSLECKLYILSPLSGQGPPQVL